MIDIRRIDDSIAVAPQIAPDDIAAIEAAGYVAVINNRPDDEQDGQPAGDAVRAAAEATGLSYTAIPVTHAGFAMLQVEAMRDALARAGGPVLAFCRSGTRSCHLWALARAAGGAHPAVLIEQAADAGYDIAPLRPLLDQLRASA